MEKIKNKFNRKGFTLVECIVAMAVLAIMSLLLTMILSVALKTRDNNMAIEKAIDNQANKLANDFGGAVTEDLSGKDIDFGSGVKIEANKIQAKKKSYDGDDARLGALDYDTSGLTFGGGSPGGNPNPGTPTHYTGYKVYGSVDLNPSINSGKVIINENKTDAGDNYRITWTIKFDVNSFTPEKSLKIRFPEKAANIKGGNYATGTYVSNTSWNAFPIAEDSGIVMRIEPKTSHIEISFNFEMKKTDYDSDYKNISNYFLNHDTPGVNTVQVNMETSS